MEKQQQRSATPVTHKTQDHPGPEANHSPQTIHAAEAPSKGEGQHQQREATNSPTENITIPDVPQKDRLKLPPANSKEWEVLDTDLNHILQEELEGTAAKKIATLQRIVYEVCLQRFGT